MKVIYEFNINDEENDNSDLKFFQIARDMYLSLYDIREYMFNLRKNWNDFSKEEIIDTIFDFVDQSNIDIIK
jgi:hypothetical protein